MTSVQQYRSSNNNNTYVNVTNADEEPRANAAAAADPQQKKRPLKVRIKFAGLDLSSLLFRELCDGLNLDHHISSPSSSSDHNSPTETSTDNISLSADSTVCFKRSEVSQSSTSSPLDSTKIVKNKRKNPEDQVTSSEYSKKTKKDQDQDTRYTEDLDQRQGISGVATNVVKEATDLKHVADRLKGSVSKRESTELYFQAALKFLRGASLYESCNEEAAAITIYCSTAKLCEFCAREYGIQKDTGGATLAYACVELAYMRVVNVLQSRGHRDTATEARDFIFAMEEASKKLNRTFAATERSLKQDLISSIRKAVDFSCNGDVKGFIHLVRVAMEKLGDHHHHQTNSKKKQQLG